MQLHSLQAMPVETPTIHDEWWIARQFKEAELKSRTDRLQQQREGAEAIKAIIAKLGLTDEDLREMFFPDDTGGSNC